MLNRFLTSRRRLPPAVIHTAGLAKTDPTLLSFATTTQGTGTSTWGGSFDSVFSVWFLSSSGGALAGTDGSRAVHDVTAKVWVADTVFTSNRPTGDGTTDREIWVMNLDGTGAYPVTNNAWEDGDAFWSPDTGTFVFESERDEDAPINAGLGYGPPATTFTNREIYSMRVDGSGLTRLTNSTGTSGKWGSSADEDPQWGPNGKIAFDTLRNGHNRAHPGGDPRDRHNWDVYLMNSDGSNPPGATALHGIPFTVNTDGSLTLGSLTSW